ncbi:MAG TPA: tRNA (adenosine(37)-N6)-threonylcarbamoyltransferase complex dimerization subunit type 1 TsaB, partial [Candidatus Krumholzibacteria bacterium]|nr:tRNA (adenosine(37)-N6)-threonylcarbamoyltransferase complex dimerization subunit type 1 TsaB [Candidatus Krumholzibacteria bacterium]
MITLSLDTSHPVGSVALARDGELVGSETFREPSSHLVALGHAVDQLLASTALTPAGIDRLAVVTGPGSFTGLRIGLSFAKGLHAARHIPMVTINALQLLALPWLAPGARVCAMIDARHEGTRQPRLFHFLAEHPLRPRRWKTLALDAQHVLEVRLGERLD